MVIPAPSSEISGIRAKYGISQSDLIVFVPGVLESDSFAITVIYAGSSGRLEIVK